MGLIESMVPGARSENLTRCILAAIIALSIIATTGALNPANAQKGGEDDAECRLHDESGIEICGPFLDFWSKHGDVDTIGNPVTFAYEEVSADSLSTVLVQYFERARLEYRPENAGTDYEVSMGRLGAEVLDYDRNVNWHSLPKAQGEPDHYFAETGHAVADEFWDYFRSNGLNLGDEGTFFRESLAMFGFPISEARMESDPNGGEVLTQWFERSRLEIDSNGVVSSALLGAEMDSSDDGLSARLRRELDANLDYWHQEFQETAFVAGLWVPDDGEWTNTIGEANRETGAPIGFDDHMRIGSTSKEFTVTIILQLVDDGMIGLDNPISEFVDGIPNGDRITLRQLANMTSGLASFTFDPEFQDTIFNDVDYQWTPEEIVDIGVRNTQAGCPYFPESCFEPGEAFFYSNTNSVLLGMVAEIVSGQSLSDLYEERIFEPLGMENTFQPSTSELPEPYAHGYTIQGLPEGTDELQDSTFWSPSWQWAVGGLVSTMDDLRVWARAVGSGELISEELQAERLTTVEFPPNSEERAYAIGIGYQHGWWGHGGSLPGYNSSAYYHPELDAVVVVLANTDLLPLGDDLVSPGHVFADVVMDIANREAERGEFVTPNR